MKAPASGAANVTGSDGARAGPAGNRNRVPEPPDRKDSQDSAAGASQKHLQDMLSDGSFEKYGVGGLDDEFLTIFRRVFASRMVAPEVVQKLGMRHVKGVLLYGPPGTGRLSSRNSSGGCSTRTPPKS